VVLGHPFKPPHLIPLIAVGGGRQTDPALLDRAVTFYTAMAKHPILRKREINGHIANRLQAALWQEAFHLVEQGVATVADIDAAIVTVLCCRTAARTGSSAAGSTRAPGAPQRPPCGRSRAAAARTT